MAASRPPPVRTLCSHLCTYTFTLLPPHLSPPIIVHHVHQNVGVRMNHRLSSASRLSSPPLSNEAAAAGDSWMSYIARLIPAYAKRSRYPPTPSSVLSSSLLPCRSGRDLRFLDDASRINFFWDHQTLRSCRVSVIACLQDRRLPSPPSSPSPTPPHTPRLSSLTLNPESGRVEPTAGQTASDKANFNLCFFFFFGEKKDALN